MSLALVVLLAAAGVVGYAAHLGPFAPDPQDVNQLAHRPQYVDPASRAEQAARQAGADGDDASAAVLERLAETPQGIWLTPEAHPPGEVADYVASVVAAADEQGRVPVLVVYGIPDRDCSGSFSGGGLDADSYDPWVAEIAGAAGGSDHAVVVLEPDALTSSIECDQRQQRVTLIARAVDDLRAAGVTTYVDAGHSDWVSVDDVAALLREVGVESVRGFATNVANYQSDDDERAYAAALSSRLGGAHYLIDSGRNGDGSTPDWCNPPGRALGAAPGYVDDGTALDALVWVKPPGESDGTCHGGPPAGEFWPERALELAGAAGW